MKKVLSALAIVISLFLFLNSSPGKALTNRFTLSETAVKTDTLSGNGGTAKLKKGDYLLLGKYSDEPILWKVIAVENGRPLLMAEHIICFKAFDACGKSEFHASDSELYGSSDWKNSSLKCWLNSSEQKVIYSHCAPNVNSVHQGTNPYNNEKGFLCEENFDKKEIAAIDNEGVFILAKEEINKYLTATERIKTCTKSALENSNADYITTTSRGTWYWTSSPIPTNGSSVCAVTSSGSFYKTLAFDGATGVCPSFWLVSTDFSFSAGSGKADDPFLFEECLN